jgi:hypothetical protein
MGRKRIIMFTQIVQFQILKEITVKNALHVLTFGTKIKFAEFNKAAPIWTL